MKKNTLSILLIITNLLSFAGGGWLQKAKSGYTQLSYTFMSYSSISNGNDGSLDLQRKISDRTLQAYAEYGLSDKFELDLVFPYKMVSTSSSINMNFNPIYSDTLESGNLKGFGNIYTAIKYNLGEGKYAHAVKLGYGWDSAPSNPLIGLQTGYSTNYINASYRISKGYTKSYINLDVSYQYMGSTYSDYFISNLELGTKVSYNDQIHTWFSFILHGYLALDDQGERNLNYPYTGLNVNGESDFSFGIKMNTYLNEHYSITVGAYGGILAKYQARAVSTSIGLAYEW